MLLPLITVVQVGSRFHGDWMWAGHKLSLMCSPVLGKPSSACLFLRVKIPSRIPTVHSQLQETYPVQENKELEKPTDQKKPQKTQTQARSVLNCRRDVSVPSCGRRQLHIECHCWEMLLAHAYNVHGSVPTNRSHFL